MPDKKDILKLVEAYIDKNYKPELPINERFTAMPAFAAAAACFAVSPNSIDFGILTSGETFSEMLLRLIAKSGENNSTIYNRANIDRRHFSKIINHKNYQPTKQTALAFAIALKLGFEKTRELLSVAGFSLTKSNLTDVIVSFFIEHKIFDVDWVNEILLKYKQPLLGLTEFRKDKDD